MCNITLAHSGRTDSKGGHKDNKNKSGLGNYHYHCGGYPAHLHTNGICPYSTSSQSSKSTTPSSSSSTKTKLIVQSDVAVTDIQINEKVESIEVGENKVLTVTITPSDATDKIITWKSSDESIATVSTTGEVVAKKSGIVDITASSSNGKTSTIKINIKDVSKIENSIEMKNLVNSKDDFNGNTTTENREDSKLLSGFLMLGLLGGVSFLGYKKYKNS